MSPLGGVGFRPAKVANPEGAIESLIRQVVNLRIKGNSKFWLKSNAEIMLHLRCQWCAKSWDNFCNSILTSFRRPPLEV